MPMLPFSDYRPDLSAYQAGGSSQLIQNVVPRGDGYGPFPGLNAYTQALPAPCRGFFYARKTDGSIAVFAGTATDLYLLNNTNFSWILVSKGGVSYSVLPPANHWQFAQFGSNVIAVQPNTVPQVYDTSSSTAFADLGGSPPQASYIAVVGRFVVLSGLLSTPYRIQWSGLNAMTTWTSGVNSSDFQDFPDGGSVLGVAGGEFGVIFQQTAIRRLVYAPGSPVIFNIERITEDKGLMAPYSLIRAANRIFFLAPQGFQSIEGTGVPVAIGKERFDRTFFADLDPGNLQMIIGAADPAATRVYWAYKSQSGTSGQFDKLLVYDYALDRAAIVLQRGEYLASLAAPGLTLENLDALAPGTISITGAANNGLGAIRLTLASEIANWTYGQADTTHAAGAPGSTNLGNASQNAIEVYGVAGTTEANGNWQFTVVDATHIDLIGSTFTHAYVSGGSIGGALDALPFSLDTISSAALSKSSAVSTAHMLSFFSGANLEATLDSAEQGLDGGRRMRVKGFRPITDAAACTGAVGARENVQSAVAYSVAQPVNGKGLCPANVSTRLARARIDIPAGTAWSFASGVEPDFTQEGKR
jgi:hypothetical protein